MTRLFGATLLLAYIGTAWAAGPPDAATWERFGEIKEVEGLNRRGVALFQAGKLGEAASVFEKVVELRERLYPRVRYPRGHADLAQSLNNLAFLYEEQSDYAKAEPLFRSSLEMYESLYSKQRNPQGHPDLAVSLRTLALMHYRRSEYAKAEPLLGRALKMYEGLYPKERYPQGHQDLVSCLNNLGILRQRQGKYAEARSLYTRALDMGEVLYPQGHPDLTLTLSHLGGLLERQGEYTKAGPLLRRALEMNRAMYPTARYPQGHADLAYSLNDLAGFHQSRRKFASAEPLYRRALTMREGLYPKERFPLGHPEVAQSLNDLALLYRLQGNSGKAEPLYARALGMLERLYPEERYPRGHPQLGTALYNLASLYDFQGEYAKAEPLYTSSLAMYERLYPRKRYPQGTPDLARGLNGLAELNRSLGKYAKAEPLHRRALGMYSDSAVSLAAFAPEATALNYLASQPLARDAYLSATLHLPKADAYSAVWQTKAALSRVYEQRHLAVLAASSEEAREFWDAVLSLKRERESLLLAPVDAARAKARDARLDVIDVEIRKKEAALLPLLPALGRSDDLAKATPDELRKALPANAAFIDLLRYTRFEQDRKVKGKKGEKRTPHFVAFVVTRDSVTRVELGGAGPIEEALGLWRQAISEGDDGQARYAARLRDLVWDPLAKQLPSGTKAVYVSPDMALSRLPWAALPGKSAGTILLEDHRLATVPHGPFLLDQLTAKRQKAPARPTVLAMGGVAYDDVPASKSALALRGPAEGKSLWPALPGTKAEVASLKKLAGERKLVFLTGDGASAAALLSALPRADSAHLATHGYFADAKFRTVLQLDKKLFGFGQMNERAAAGARSPMVLSGLVCAGANLEGTPNRGVVTADAIAGLDLRKLKLAVLSACETGLGDVAGGEGVFGLARAFHVAGTRNVVASLWKVDDEATAALMALFYREMWVNEATPAEAMRRAQLAVYRDPKSVREWARGRGPNLKVVLDGPKGKPAKGAKTSPPKAWAAFVLSGAGD